MSEPEQLYTNQGGPYISKRQNKHLILEQGFDKQGMVLFQWGRYFLLTL